VGPVAVVGLVLTQAGCLSVVDEMVANRLGHGHEQGLGMPIGAVVFWDMMVVVTNASIDLHNNQTAVRHRRVWSCKIRRHFTRRMVLIYRVAAPVEPRIPNQIRFLRGWRGRWRQRLCRIHSFFLDVSKIHTIFFYFEISQLFTILMSGDQIANYGLWDRSEKNLSRERKLGRTVRKRGTFNKIVPFFDFFSSSNSYLCFTSVSSAWPRTEIPKGPAQSDTPIERNKGRKLLDEETFQSSALNI